jgi:hypothetical protein
VSTLSPMCTTPSWWTARQGRLVIPIDSMSNLPTGTQETKNAFESHKAKVTNRIYEATGRIELGKCQAECCHPATCPAASVPHGDSSLNDVHTRNDSYQRAHTHRGTNYPSERSRVQ